MRIATRRVVITGIGLVTPVGVGTEQTWSGLLAGQSGLGPITQFDTEGHVVRIAGEVDGFDAEAWVGSRKDARKMDRFIHFAMAASKMALADAGLEIPVPEPERTGVIIGVGMGGIQTIEDALEVMRVKGPKRLSPFLLPRMLANLAPGQVSIAIGAEGPNWGPVSACSTGAHAVGEAARMVALGDVDVAVAGGAEATITPLGIGGFAAMKALSRRNDDPQAASRPFDADRDGFVAAEGAGVMILESLAHAQSRGARILGEVAGYGQSSDAYHVTKPAPGGRGACLAMRRALDSAGLQPTDITYVNAHGTSTPFNDATESLALETVFGDHARQLWVSSTKSMTGHMLGAAGAVEAAVCALAVSRGQVPPTINYTTPDPDCRLDYVPNAAREKRIDAALSNSFGFGGTNVSLVIRRFGG